MSTIPTKLDVLAPFEIWDVPLGNGKYIKFLEPLVLTPTWMPHDPDEPGDVEYLEVEVPELEISAWGKDRRELWRCIFGDIREAWECFVQAKSHTPHGKQVQANYLAIAEEMDNE